MKVSITVTQQPPPHQVSGAASPSRKHVETPLEEIPETACNTLCEAVWEAYRSGLFNAGGCVNVVIQRAAVAISK